MFRGKPITSELKIQIVKFLCKKAKLENFEQRDILWKNLSKELQETQQITITSSQLYNYFLDELIFDIQKKKLDIAQDDIYRLCYPLILHLCNFKFRFEESEDMKTIRKEKLAINKLIIKYFLTENKFSQNLWNEFSKYFNFTKAKYFFININDPKYELTLHEKWILRKHIIQKEMRKEDDIQKHPDWLSKNQQENHEPDYESESKDETILDENQLKNFQDANVVIQQLSTTPSYTNGTNTTACTDDRALKLDDTRTGVNIRKYLKRRFKNLDDSSSGAQSDETVIFNPKTYHSINQEGTSFLLQKTLHNNRIQSVEMENSPMSTQTATDCQNRKSPTTKRLHLNEELIQLSSDEENFTIPYSFYDNLSSNDDSDVDET